MQDNKRLAEIYNRRFPKETGPSRSRLWYVLANKYFLGYLDGATSILDVGSGRGEFINEIKIAKRIAVDLNPEAGSFLKPDVQFINCPADNLSSINTESLDAVFTSNFFEHLPDKGTLDRSISEIFRTLRPNGTLICLGPNIKFVGGAYWDFYDHHLPLTEKSLQEALELAGFEVVKVISKFLPFTTKSKIPQADWLVYLYLKLPMFWPLLGKQFLVVAKKKLG